MDAPQPNRCASLLRRLTVAVLVTAVLLTALAGCSGIKLAYNHVDLLIRVQADRYLNMTAQQRQWFSRELDGLHAWHRKTQLPKYSAALREFAARAQSGPIPAGDVYRAEATVRAWTKELATQFTPLAGRLLVQADDQQLVRLRKALDEENQETLDDARELTAQAQHAKTRKRLVDGYEMSLGTLDARQLAVIDAAMAKLRPTQGERVDYLRRWQRDMLELLARQRKSPDCFVAGFAKMSADREHWYSPNYRAAETSNAQVYRELGVKILVSASVEQRRHMAEKFNEWATLLDDLAGQQTTGSVTVAPSPAHGGTCAGAEIAARAAGVPGV